MINHVFIDVLRWICRRSVLSIYLPLIYLFVLDQIFLLLLYLTFSGKVVMWIVVYGGTKRQVAGINIKTEGSKQLSLSSLMLKKKKKHLLAPLELNS